LQKKVHIDGDQRMFRALMFCIMLICAPHHAAANSFSCPIGKRASCLDYNDKVCSMFAKCVDSDATCFDAYTCGFGGFVCKSKFDDLASDYESLRQTCRSVAYEHDQLVEKYNRMLSELQDAESRRDALARCIMLATSLQQAQMCH